MNDGNTLMTPTFKLSETVVKYGDIFENIPKGQKGTVVMDGGFYSSHTRNQRNNLNFYSPSSQKGCFLLDCKTN